MKYELSVMFPMSIDASPLFRAIHKQSAEWRAEVDLTKVAKGHIARLRNTPAPPLPKLQSRGAKGKHVNLVA